MKTEIKIKKKLRIFFGNHVSSGTEKEMETAQPFARPTDDVWLATLE